jgi:hypothetical protein
VAAIAFLSALIPYCPCPDMRAPKAAEHDCCAPVAGLRAASCDSCAHHDDAGATADATKMFSPAALASATMAIAQAAVGPTDTWPSALRPSFCPSPPTILRI